MNSLSALFASPDHYPLEMDFARQVLRFVQMSPVTYRDSVFLDKRTRFLGGSVHEMRLDDVLFAASNQPRTARPIHYILHTTFCCSTLLARYFELLEFCFVLKEPLLLTQLALTPSESVRRWDDVFDVGVRLLTRAYEPGQAVIIKPHEPCNHLAQKLLAHDSRSTITFLITPLKDFLLAILKSRERRDWVHTRLRTIALSASSCPALADINSGNLTDAQAAAYLWLVNRFLCGQLTSGPCRSRVLVLNGNHVAESPEDVIPKVAALCELGLNNEQLEAMLTHASVRKYSKDVSKPYDADSRREEMAQLDERFGSEAEAGIKWAATIINEYEQVALPIELV